MNYVGFSAIQTEIVSVWQTSLTPDVSAKLKNHCCGTKPGYLRIQIPARNKMLPFNDSWISSMSWKQDWNE